MHIYKKQPQNLITISFLKKYFPSPTAIKYLEKDKECSQYLNILIDECIGEVIVNLRNRELMGYVFVYKKGKNKGFIFNLFVVEKYRHKGFGNMLINDAVNIFNGIDLTVGKDNKVAIDLYKKNGFKIIGDGNTKDEYYMKLENQL